MADAAAPLKPAPNQVAGHRFDEGREGSMVDDSGRFYKPLQSGERGQDEVEFYKKITADASIPSAIASIFPGFFGTKEVARDGTTIHYLAMEDLTHGYEKPCILDIKMGRRTWWEGAPQKYIHKCLEKDASTTSGDLGYRIAGMQVFDPVSGATWRADRVWCKEVAVSEMPAGLRKFFSADPNGSGAASEEIVQGVLAGEAGVLSRLRDLRAWFATQTTYHFYSASILIVYDGQPGKGASRRPSLRMVDFAHVIPGNASLDTNFLEAIDAVFVALEAIVAECKP